MRKLEDYRIKDFAFDERRWRVDWLGAVTFAERFRRASQPLIEVQLSCVPGYLHSLNDLFTATDGEPREIRQVRLPVALLPLLRIGDIWECGRLVDRPTYDLIDFPDTKIDRTKANLIKAGLNADDEGNYFLPWEHHPCHMRHTQSYCVTIDRGDTKIVVPATELIRFYFGSSGDLVARLFDAPFDDAKFWNSAEPADNRGNAKIDLASGISCRSASTVARIAFSAPARRAAEIIGRSCVAATANGQKVYPKALFPFEGQTDLAACGRWLPFKRNDRGVFLVFQLLSCSHHFPFSGLHYTGERKDVPNGKTGFGAAGRSEPKDGGDRFARRTKEPKSLVDEEPDGNKKPRDVALDELKREQFPDLGKKRVIKVDIDFVPTVVMTVGDSSHLTGVSVGGGGTNRAMQPVDFIAVSPIMEAAAVAGKPRKFEPAAAVFLGLVGSLVPEKKFTSVDIVRLDRRQRHDYLCTLPPIVDEDGVVNSWCLVNDGAENLRNRKISIARIQEFYATHYILMPEAKEETDVMAGSLEVHFISDRSRSISLEADLLAALSIHVLSAPRSGTRFQLGEGVTSIRHHIYAPADADDKSMHLGLTAVREYFMAFVHQESPGPVVSVTPGGEIAALPVNDSPMSTYCTSIVGNFTTICARYRGLQTK